MSPTISIVIPSFNCGKYISRTIVSILDQDYGGVEIVIIDGGSSDSTPRIVGDFIQQGAPIKYISESDRGQFEAIIKGLRIAKGDILAFQNADDEYAPNTFRDVAVAFTEHGANVSVIGNMEVIDDRGKVHRTVPTIPFTLPSMLTGGCHVPSQATFFGRGVWNQVEAVLPIELVYDIHFSMERLLLGLCASHSDRLIYSSRVFGRFRLHTGTKTHSLTVSERRRVDDSIASENRAIVQFYIDRGYVRPFRRRDIWISLARKSYFLIRGGWIAEFFGRVCGLRLLSVVQAECLVDVRSPRWK